MALWWTAAVEWWTAATGDAGTGASAAAEWDDRGEHDYSSLGCSPTHLAVPLIPRHAGGGDGGRQAEVEKRLEWLTQSAGGAEERLWRMSELGGELTGSHDDGGVPVRLWRRSWRGGLRV